MSSLRARTHTQTARCKVSYNDRRADRGAKVADKVGGGSGEAARPEEGTCDTLLASQVFAARPECGFVLEALQVEKKRGNEALRPANGSRLWRSCSISVMRLFT